MNKEEKLFTIDNAWSGNNYELYININSTNKDDILNNALKRLWSHPTLSGCYLRNDLEPDTQALISADQAPLSTNTIYGVATLPNGKKIACKTYPVTIDDEHSCFYFMLPFGSLQRKYEIGSYPFQDSLALDWQKTIDYWLCDLSKYIFKKNKFTFGAFGFIDCENLEDIIPLNISDDRYYGIITEKNGKLSIYHPTIYEYPFK
jgi:hypothetical protein